MHRHVIAGIGLSFGALVAACSGESSSGTNASGTGGAGTSASTTSSAATTGTATSTTSTTGTGGATTGTGGATTGTGGTGGGTPGTPGDHVLISEIATQPDGADFIELYNPTAAAVDLSNYYISDNSAYFGIAKGDIWAPAGTAETDFLAQFPTGTMIAPGGVLVIASSSGFEAKYMKCPDFILATTPLPCGAGTVKAMIAPTNGGIGTMPGALLSNAREMVILFVWDGSSPVVKDVDYVTWGDTFDDATRVYKTGLAGYLGDTLRADQKPALAPELGESIERCGPALEQGEKTNGGNGLTGHDETSEDFAASFKLQMTPTPGVKNSCL